MFILNCLALSCQNKLFFKKYLLEKPFNWNEVLAQESYDKEGLFLSVLVMVQTGISQTSCTHKLHLVRMMCGGICYERGREKKTKNI